MRHEVIVYVEHGMVYEVYANTPGVVVHVVDFDNDDVRMPDPDTPGGKCSASHQSFEAHARPDFEELIHEG